MLHLHHATNSSATLLPVVSRTALRSLLVTASPLPLPLPLLQEVPRYHELPTLEEREAAGEAGPSLEDEYLDQINPIYDALSFAATEEDEALTSLPTDKAFVMSRAMYV